jgi:hypothetical protein
MNPVFELLMASATIGAVDVLYLHLYRFRLYAQPGSVAEEVTHLARQVVFLGLVGVLLASPPWTRPALAALFTVDLVNSIADVLLERSSRAPLGGLPSVEYLLHVLTTFLTGAAVASAWWVDPEPLIGFAAVRAWATLALGGLLLAAEGGMFAVALGRRASASEVARLPG